MPKFQFLLLNGTGQVEGSLGPSLGRSSGAALPHLTVLLGRLADLERMTL